jgi:DNA-binding NtrC family response regulator
MSAAHILIVDDEPDIRLLVQEILEDEGYEVEVAANGSEARSARRARRPDLILLDVWMPDIDGISLLKEWNQGDGLDVPVVVMSGHGTVETAVEATRLGAYDFLEKPLSTAKLLLTIQRGLEVEKLSRENTGLRSRSIAPSEPIGQSEAIRTLRDQVKRIAQHDAPVLISGESGTGKEVFARYLHQHSARALGPFTHVTVASLAEKDSAAELFGVEEGDTVYFGALERANTGILFLEDIADMDLGIQAKLLGALENQSFLRVGGTEPVQVNARIIAATSEALQNAVSTGAFREDLYYLLNVVPLDVPPLREHPEDIPALLEFFVDQFVGHEGLPYRQFTVASQNSLRQYAWPGNIRELRNVVQRLLILGNGEEIDAEEVDLALGGTPTAKVADVGQDSDGFDLPLKEAREQFERRYLKHQLREANGNVSKVATTIGIERTHLYRKMKALGIDAKDISRSGTPGSGRGASRTNG